MVMVAVEQRVVYHPERSNAHPVRDPDKPKKRRQRKRRDDPGGSGAANGEGASRLLGLRIRAHSGDLTFK